MVENQIRLWNENHRSKINLILLFVCNFNVWPVIQLEDWVESFISFLNSNSTVINSLTRFLTLPFGENSFLECGPTSPFLVNANAVMRTRELWSSGDCCSLQVSLELRNSQEAQWIAGHALKFIYEQRENRYSLWTLQYGFGFWCLADTRWWILLN